MSHFVGQFFLTTKFSIYRVTIPEDLKSRPTVQKWATKITQEDLGRELHVPVGGSFRFGYFLGITSCGMFQYNMPPDHAGGPVAFELVPGIFRAKNITQTRRIVGIFLGCRQAEECYEATKAEKTGKRESFKIFHPFWWTDTKKALVTIGTDHPLVVISTNQSNRFGVPEFLWNPNVDFPQLHD